MNVTYKTTWQNKVNFAFCKHGFLCFHVWIVGNKSISNTTRCRRRHCSYWFHTSTETGCQWEWCSKLSSRTSTSVAGSGTAQSAVATSRRFGSKWSDRWTACCSSPGDSKMRHQWLSYVLLWMCVRSYSLSHHCQLSELWVSSVTICFFCVLCIEFS